ASEEAAPASVKRLVIFHGDNSGFHGVERTAAALQHLPALGQRSLHAVQVRAGHIIRNGPGSAMDHQYGKLSQRFGPSQNEVKQLSLAGKRDSARDRVVG